MKLFLFLSTTIPFTLLAQPVQVGIKGGFVLTDSTRQTSDESRNYTVGPTIEFRLPFNLGIETGVLYKHIGTDHALLFNDTRATIRMRGNSFEVPVVGKYYIRSSSAFTPYLGLGVAMRRAWQTTESSTTGPPNPFFPTGNFRRSEVSPWGAGAVGAAGVQFRHGRWKISPEFRYTRWSKEGQSIPRNPNQVEFLVGLSF